jgi:hypothetical protein
MAAKLYLARCRRNSARYDHDPTCGHYPRCISAILGYSALAPLGKLFSVKKYFFQNFSTSTERHFLILLVRGPYTLQVFIGMSASRNISNRLSFLPHCPSLIKCVYYIAVAVLLWKLWHWFWRSYLRQTLFRWDQSNSCPSRNGTTAVVAGGSFSGGQ